MGLILLNLPLAFEEQALPHQMDMRGGRTRREEGHVLSLGRYLDQQHRRRACPEFVDDRAMASML
jgi:hypothetical protein